MSVTAAYSYRTGKARILKGQLHYGRPQLWTVKAKYQTPLGPRSTTLKPSQPCNLTDLSPLLTAEINADGAECGGIWDLEWIATSR